MLVWVGVICFVEKFLANNTLMSDELSQRFMTFTVFKLPLIACLSHFILIFQFICSSIKCQSLWEKVIYTCLYQSVLTELL